MKLLAGEDTAPDGHEVVVLIGDEHASEHLSASAALEADAPIRVALLFNHALRILDGERIFLLRSFDRDGKELRAVATAVAVDVHAAVTRRGASGLGGHVHDSAACSVVRLAASDVLGVLADPNGGGEVAVVLGVTVVPSASVHPNTLGKSVVAAQANVLARVVCGCGAPADVAVEHDAGPVSVPAAKTADAPRSVPVELSHSIALSLVAVEGLDAEGLARPEERAESGSGR
mmetsp:Transcript_49261/g.115721  ORF Transcript_49261/g.115721 Transcript_49261/m.115721 type:complete len:232 (+) Transcript_49261:1582-2277(+)